MSSLKDKAKEAASRAYSPYSTAKVGAAIETTDGRIYSGCNIENASYGGTVCAERVAIWKAVSEAPTKLRKVYVYTNDGWPPCGMCLQVITEFADADLEVTICDESGNEKTRKFKEFLPMAFTPDHLD